MQTHLTHESAMNHAVEPLKIERSKRDSEARWYKHQPLDNDPFLSANREQQDAVLHLNREKPHGRHFNLGVTQVQNMFEKRETEKKAFEFSAHDHRHAVEANGFFNDFDGNRLYGRKNVRPTEQRLHHTNNDFLTHYSREPVVGGVYETSTAESFQGYKAIPAPTCRRFPKLYGEPKSGPVEIENNNTKWVGNDMDYVPPAMKTEQMGLSQWRFVPAPDRAPRKQWRYTYHSAPTK